MPPLRPILPLLLLPLLLLPSHCAQADPGPPPPPAPVPLLTLSGGTAQLFDGADRPFGSIGWRPAARLGGHLGADFLVAAGTHGERYVAAGFFCELPLVSRLVLTPAFTVGWYDHDGEDGHADDLGFPVEFRTSLQLDWCFHSGIRIGLSAFHISNASLGLRNPGTEALALVLSFPLGRPASTAPCLPSPGTVDAPALPSQDAEKTNGGQGGTVGTGGVFGVPLEGESAEGWGYEAFGAAVGEGAVGNLHDVGARVSSSTTKSKSWEVISSVPTVRSLTGLLQPRPSDK